MTKSKDFLDTIKIYNNDFSKVSNKFKYSINRYY